MQSLLWMLLAGTLALAGIVRDRRLYLMNIRLDNQQIAGNVSLQPPRDWTVRQGKLGVIFEEPVTPDRAPRLLEVWHARCEGFLSPLEYLVQTQVLDADMLKQVQSAGEQAHIESVRHIRMGDWPGISISLGSRIGAVGLALPWQKQTVACTILPSGDALVMRMNGNGPVEAGDEELVRRVAETLRVDALGPVQRGGAIDLLDGLSVEAPGELATYAASDPFRTGRILVNLDQPSWLGVELTPCLLSMDEDQRAVSELIALREPGRRWGSPVRLDARTWSIRRSDELFPAQAFIRTSPRGQAIILELRWTQDDPANAHRAEELAQALLARIEYPADRSVDKLALAGANAAQGLYNVDLDTLGPETPEERWQWYHEALPRASVTTIRYSRNAGGMITEVKSAGSPPLTPLGWDVYQWELTRDWQQYKLSRITSHGELASQETLARGTDLITTVRNAEGVGQPIRVNRSARFVPGGVIPLVLGIIPFEPMLLQTESLPLPVTPASGKPLMLILVGSSRVDLQACKLEYSIVSPK